MNWLTVIGLAGLCLAAFYALVRVERRALWLVVALLVVPGAVVLVGWATIGGQWQEVLAGAGLAAVVGGAWWAGIGRKLPRSSSDAIAVWGQEKAPKPKPGEVEAMQAELRRLKAENERLADEMRGMRGNGGKRSGEDRTS